MVSNLIEILVNIKVSDFRSLNGSPVITKKIDNNFVHILAVDMLVVLVIDVFYELHDVNVMPKCRDPGLKFQVFVLN